MTAMAAFAWAKNLETGPFRRMIGHDAPIEMAGWRGVREIEIGKNLRQRHSGRRNGIA
jgi:hypothetical protein